MYRYAAFLAIVVGCSSGAENLARIHVERRDSSGVQIVHSRWTGDLPTLPWNVQLSPSLSIGSEVGSTAIFANVDEAVRLSDGSILVLPAVAITNLVSDGRIISVGLGGRFLAPRLYDRSGGFVRYIGREGRGPGEFGTVSLLALVPGSDSILVYDSNLRTINIFTPSGSFARVVSMPKTERVPNVSGIMRDGMLVVSQVRQESVGRPAPWLEDHMLATPDGKITDTLVGGLVRFRPRVPETLWKASFVHYTVGARRLYYNDELSHDIWAYSPGEQPRVFRTGMKFRTPTREHAEHYRARELEGLSVKPAELAKVKENLDKMAMPDRLPAYWWMLEDSEGHLWVMEYRTAFDLPQHWLVFDPAGALLGGITLPGDWKVHEIGKDYILASSPDSNDVIRVGVFALNRSAK
jgi:hypothetical protein